MPVTETVTGTDGNDYDLYKEPQPYVFVVASRTGDPAYGLRAVLPPIGSSGAFAWLVAINNGADGEDQTEGSVTSSYQYIWADEAWGEDDGYSVITPDSVTEADEAGRWLLCGVYSTQN